MWHMNAFRILGDVSHTLSKCILIWAIHVNKSAEGVSLITQVLYAAVFLTRYIDLFWASPAEDKWNFVLKIFYISSSFYIIFVMMRVYARTREREKAWRLGAYCLGGSVLLAPVLTAIALGKRTNIIQILWTFSIVLESLCVVPQLLLLRQTTVPTVIDSGYILTLGSYRGFYILNWIVRWAGKEHYFNWRSTLFGVIQTALYIDFAWVYWSRQRVKLRNGGIVDSDDLSRGFLVSRIFGHGDASLDDEETTGLNDASNGNAGKARIGGQWGQRGISVSADEGLEDTRWPSTKGARPADSKKSRNHGFASDEDSEDGALRP